MTTVQDFRKIGKIRITRKRYVQKVVKFSYPIKVTEVLLPLHEIRKEKLQSLISPKGGATIVEFTGHDNNLNNLTFLAVATCSKKDVFINRVGLIKALGLLKSAIEFYQKLKEKEKREQNG